MDTLLQALVDAATAQYAGSDAHDQARFQIQRMNELSAKFFHDAVHDESTLAEIRSVVKTISETWDLTLVQLVAKQQPCPYLPGYYLKHLLSYQHPNIFRTLFA